MVQAHRERGEHFARKLRVFLQLAEEDGARDQEQSGFDQRLGEDDVRRIHEHHRFAEGLAGTDDVDDLLVATRRSEREFDLAVENEVEPARRVALVEQDFAACGRQLARAARQAGELVVAQAVEQRYLGEQGGDVEVGASLHGGRWAAELSVMPDRRTHRPAQQAGSHSEWVFASRDPSQKKAVRRAQTTDGLVCSGLQGFTAPKTSLSCWLTRMKVVRLDSSLSWRAPT